MLKFRTPDNLSKKCGMCNHAAIVKEYEVSVKEVKELLRGEGRVLLLRSFILHYLQCGNVINRRKNECRCSNS